LRPIEPFQESSHLLGIRLASRPDNAPSSRPIGPETPASGPAFIVTPAADHYWSLHMPLRSVGNRAECQPTDVLQSPDRHNAGWRLASFQQRPRHARSAVQARLQSSPSLRAIEDRTWSLSSFHLRFSLDLRTSSVKLCSTARCEARSPAPPCAR